MTIDQAAASTVTAEDVTDVKRPKESLTATLAAMSKDSKEKEKDKLKKDSKKGAQAKSKSKGK